MKTKKLLSIILTLAMVVSMVSIMGCTASAERKSFYANDPFTYTMNNKYDTAEVEGNVCNFQIDTTKSTSVGTISATPSGNQTLLEITATKYGVLKITYDYYKNSSWKSSQLNFTIFPSVRVGESTTLPYSEIADGLENSTAKDFSGDECADITYDSTNQIFTITGKKQGLTTLNYEYNNNVSGWTHGTLSGLAKVLPADTSKSNSSSNSAVVSNNIKSKTTNPPTGDMNTTYMVVFMATCISVAGLVIAIKKKKVTK